MLDVNFIRENPQKVKDACKNKNANVDVDRVLELDKKKRELMTEIETLTPSKIKLAAVELKIRQYSRRQKKLKEK